MPGAFRGGAKKYAYLIIGPNLEFSDIGYSPVLVQISQVNASRYSGKDSNICEKLLK
jgi:hypothetical protein